MTNYSLKTNTYCENLQVSRVTFTDLIKPRFNTSVTIDGLDLANVNVNSNNTVIGSGAGAALTTGTTNTLLGTNAGAAETTQTGCVLIGNDAGQNNTVSNRLMISNSNTDTPLIDGDFSGPELRLNGDVVLGNNDNSNTMSVNQLIITDGGLVHGSDYIKIFIHNVAYYLPLYQ